MMVPTEPALPGVGRGAQGVAAEAAARRPVRRSVALLAAIAGLAAQPLPNVAAWSQSTSTIAYADGRWFDGTRFEHKDVVYSIDGRLSFSPVQLADETIDLAGAWVVPPFADAHYVRELGVLDNLTVLRMWVETTPATIFPDRRIGYLREGFEASFLALSGDPLTDFENVRRITLRIKEGRTVGSTQIGSQPR